MRKIISSPYTALSAAIIFVLTLYQFNWSDLYPELTIDTYIFLLIAIITNTLTYALSKTVKIIKKNNCPTTKDWALFYIINIGLTAEIVNAGTIPILAIARGDSYDYTQFGIKTLHVVLMAMLTLYTIKWFTEYSRSNIKTYLFFSASCLMWPLIIANRGSFIIIFLALILILISKAKISSILFKIFPAVMLVILFFGVIGDMRSAPKGEPNSSDFITNLGKANINFESTGLPKPIFWFYLYATSPLATLQQNVNFKKPAYDFQTGLTLDFIPDFISKHITPEQGNRQFEIEKIHPALTVGTAYSRAFGSMGWLGVYGLHMYFIFICGLASYLTKNTSYQLPVIYLLSSSATLMLFDNMLIFSGTIAPIILAVLLSIIYKTTSKSHENRPLSSTTK